MHCCVSRNDLNLIITERSYSLIKDGGSSNDKKNNKTGSLTWLVRAYNINKAAGKHVRHNMHCTLHVKYSVVVCCLGFQSKQTLNLCFVPL